MKKKLSLICIIIFFLFFSSNTQLIYGNLGFSSALELGTQIRTVDFYKENIWNETLGKFKSPESWFYGRSDIETSKSKITIIDKYRGSSKTSFIFKKYFFSKNFISNIDIIENQGYGNSFIDSNFSNNYESMIYAYNKWYFNTNRLQNKPDIFYDFSTIILNPRNFSILLSDYNNYADLINNNSHLQEKNISLSYFNAHNFLLNLGFRDYIIGTPIQKYLSTIIDSLNPKNITFSSDKLTFHRKGLKNYTIEIKFNNDGIIDTFSFKDSNGVLFYKITSIYPKEIMITIIIFLIIIIVILSFLYYIINRLRKKF